MDPFRRTTLVMPGSPSARGPFPKNLTINFGAHLSSIYGGTSASKTAALTAAATDQVRESHARELKARPIRPKILDEEFFDFHKLLDVAEVDTTPLILPCLPDRNPPGQPQPLRLDARRRLARG